MRDRFGTFRGEMRAVEYREREYVGLEAPPGVPRGFIKPPRYQGQDEVRMIWEVPSQPYKPFLLRVPMVTSICRRVL